MSLYNPDFFQKYYKELKKIKKVFCGFSGGADSTALLLLLTEYSKKYNFKLKAVHYQHGLRGEESFQDSKFCADFCESRNIDFIEINIDVKSLIKGKESFEDRARSLRLSKWKELCSSEDSVVALGHNSDDRNENILIRLLRGSNLSGLTSLREIQYIEGFMIIRPLLNYSRSEIENFLISNDITFWRKDSSNNNNKILRNYIRNIVLPGLSELYPGTRDGIKRAALVLLEDALFIEGEVEKKWQKLFASSNFINLEEYIKLNNALKIRILRRYLSNCLKRDYVPTYDLLKRIDDEILRLQSSKNKNRFKIPLPEEKDYFIELNRESFRISREDKENFPSIIWHWHKNPKIKWGIWDITIKRIKKINTMKTEGEFSAFFPEDAIPEKLKISSVLPGEKMIPFGMQKDVSLRKLFENKKIPSNKKGVYPVFSLPEGKIIWVAGVRRANYAPLTGKTNI
ncbi:MAG TPA: tRNA lysidine(34) synthetase TilS, partial [Victivallales bacterium]|nr:tRNA lysidine(34) synthetase TilS [Victivallales bacterium]